MYFVQISQTYDVTDNISYNGVPTGTDSINNSAKHANQSAVFYKVANGKIKKNEFVGIVGETGSGKSTLVDLLIGLMEPNEGTITVDGQNINKNSKTIISIFSGRMSDVGKDPIPIIKESVRLTRKLKNVQILWASTREAYNYLQAKDYKCSIITMPPSIIKRISKFGKSYQELTLDTVKKFLKDSKDSNFKI